MSEEIRDQMQGEVEQIQEETPDLREVIDIVKRETYQELLEALKRIKLKVEIANIDQLNITSGEKNLAAEKKAESKLKKDGTPKVETLTFKEVKKHFKDGEHTSYLVVRDDNYYGFVGKSLITKVDGNTLYLTPQAQNWFTEDKITWQEPQPN